MWLPYPVLTGNNHYEHGVKRVQHEHGVKHIGSVRLKEEVKTYRTQLHGHLYAQGAAGLKLKGPLEVWYRLNPPDDRDRDSENALKVMKDALTKGGFWVDDSNKVLRREVIEWKPVVPGGRILVIARPFEEWE